MPPKTHGPRKSNLSSRELATVLAALRLWQDVAKGSDGGMPHFDDQPPLSVEEINKLCERLNCVPVAPEAPEVPEAPTAKPRVNLAVQMFGGTIQRVYHDNPNVKIRNVVFTEDAKYLDESDDRNKNGTLRFAVQRGEMAGDGIYTSHKAQFSRDDVAAVLEANRKRMKSR